MLASRQNRFHCKGVPMNSDLTLPTTCSFEPSDWQILARHWYPVAHSADVGAEPHKAMLLDEPLVAYRVRGELVVARDICPHRGAYFAECGEVVVVRLDGGRCDIVLELLDTLRATPANVRLYSRS
jgi:hypothetical protein